MEAGDELQDSFIDSLINNNVESLIFLVNGIKLTGRIKRFDRYTLTLELDSNNQLVYKHAISTIMPWNERYQKEFNKPHPSLPYGKQTAYNQGKN